jgi:squalene-hopene/tetraprenyl-beta-curcumene cyclase
MTATETAGIDEARLRSAIDRATQWLLADQHEDGYWWGELEANASITAEYLLLTHHLGIADREVWAKIARYLRHQQQPQGYWSQWYGGPGELSTTIEAYFALKLSGEDPNAPHMVRSRDWVLAQGGIAEARVFTKLWLALFDQYDWDSLPAMPPWVVLLPSWFPINVYEFASWARATIVGVTVIFSLKPTATVPAGSGVQELWCDAAQRRQFAISRPRNPFSWQSLFFNVDKVLRFMERNHVRPFQRRALGTAERWLLDRQEADGSWGGIQPPWVYAILALRALGYPLDHPVMSKALQGFDNFTREEPDPQGEPMLWIEPCLSPIWDTGLAALALQDAGLPRDHPALRRAGEWLLHEQVFDGGDWQVKNPDTPPGGWAFEFDNDVYPDMDDSALVLIALDGIDLPDGPAKRRAMDAGLRWTLSMQSENGGWGAFDVDNTKAFITKIPFGDFGATLDPPTADVTAHVLELLGRLGYRGEFPPAERALRFLDDLQEADGSWWGRWGVNYIYGLGAVLPALEALGESMRQPGVRKAVDWLRRHQLADGGWGEDSASYAEPDLRGAGPSTPSQTAWALMGLISAGEKGSLQVARGIRYLLDRQRRDGTWEEPEFTGTGFPNDFMINYHLYRHYFPLMALGRYATSNAKAHAPG